MYTDYDGHHAWDDEDDSQDGLDRGDDLRTQAEQDGFITGAMPYERPDNDPDDWDPDIDGCDCSECVHRRAQSASVFIPQDVEPPF